MGRQGSSAAIGRHLLVSLDPTWKKERTDSSKLSSELHTYAMAGTCMYTHTNTHTI